MLTNFIKAREKFVNSSETSSPVLLRGKDHLVPKSLTEDKRVMAGQGRLIGCFHVILTLDQIFFSFATNSALS